MHDKRIYRGNTYASPMLPASATADAVEVQKQNDIRRRLNAARRAEKQRRPKTPEAVEGRKHMDVQTELYLEEFADKVPETYASTQTDAFLDRAPSPLYIPQKSGIDAETQILDGDLFDFDYEVDPILEVLVGKALEQSLMEVLEEEELASLRRRQLEFEGRRNAELVEVQRLEEAEKRRVQEKERRKQEARKLLEEKQQTVVKISARAFAENYLSSLIPDVIDNLQQSGYFYDTVYKEVEQNYLPWLTSEVEKQVAEVSDAEHLIDAIIEEALLAMQKRYEAPPPTPVVAPVMAMVEGEGEPIPVSTEDVVPQIVNDTITDQGDEVDETERQGDAQFSDADDKPSKPATAEGDESTA